MYHQLGQHRALIDLGLYKSAASMTSTIIPKALGSSGIGHYADKLKPLKFQRTRTAWPGLATDTPALMYATAMGPVSKKTSPSGLAFRSAILDEALPDIRKLRNTY